MSTDAGASGFARLRVEVVVRITDPRALVETALDEVAADPTLADRERDHAVAAVNRDAAEALSFLVDPYELVSGVPGVELAQASWSCEAMEYAPETAGPPGRPLGEVPVEAAETGEPTESWELVRPRGEEAGEEGEESEAGEAGRTGQGAAPGGEGTVEAPPGREDEWGDRGWEGGGADRSDPLS